MASTGLQVAGLASNFDWKEFVDQIMELERTPINRLEAEKSTNSLKSNLLATLGTKLSSLQSAVSALNTDTSLFGKRTAKSSTSGSTWSSSPSTNATAGIYKIAVSQLATAATLKGDTNIGTKLSATDGSDVTLSSMPTAMTVTAGKFTVEGVEFTVDGTENLKDVLDDIATQTGLTAEYLTGSDTVRLVKGSGSVMLGAATDTSNFLRALKLSNNGTGTVESATALGVVKKSAFLSGANFATAIAGVDLDGDGAFKINGKTIDYNVNTDTLTTVLAKINDSDAGVTATYDASLDQIVLKNKSTGNVGITISDTTGNLAGVLKLTSDTTFEVGDDAEFSINDGGTLTSASNTLDSSSHGITGLSVTVTSETTETITVAADTSAMRAKIEDFVTKYNELHDYIESQTKITTDAKGKVTSGSLASNREVQDWARSLRSFAFSTVTGLSGSIDQLDDLGIDFDTTTGKLEIYDGAKLDSALADDTVDVAAFFETNSTGFADRLDTFLDKITEQNSDQQENFTTYNNKLDDQIAAIERQLEQRRSLLESAFIQMENAQLKISQQQSAINGLNAQVGVTAKK